MNTVDEITARCRATISEFEAFTAQHRALIERAEEYGDRSGSAYRLWWDSLTDEAGELLERYYHSQVQAEVAKRTLAFWEKD